MTTIEDLNKTQLILLVLLISFVTTIATGIITTSLLSQAPVSVTQTINRVVERTIETVVPASDEKEIALKKEDKELLTAVSKVSQSVVMIEEVLPPSSTSTPASFQGIIATKDGLVVSSLANVASDKSYVMVLADKSRIPVTLAATSTLDNIAIFRIKSEKVGGADSVAQ